MFRKPLPALIALLSSSLVFADEVDLSVEGLSGDLEANVEAYLSSIPTEEYDTSLRFQARIGRSIKESLNALGYYNPQIDFEVVDSKKELIVNINPGSPTLIKELDIQISGEASSDSDFADLIKNSGLELNKPINHAQYDGLKSSIRNLALRKGYFEGDFLLHRLEVAPELDEAFVRLHCF